MKNYEFKWSRAVIVTLLGVVVMFGVVRGVREFTGIDSDWVVASISFLYWMIAARFFFAKKSVGNRESSDASAS